MNKSNEEMKRMIEEYTGWRKSKYSEQGRQDRTKTPLCEWRVYDEYIKVEFEVEWTWKEYLIATITMIAIIILI